MKWAARMRTGMAATTKCHGVQKYAISLDEPMLNTKHIGTRKSAPQQSVKSTGNKRNML